MRVNQPADSDGEQALWLDGKLVSHLGKGFPNGRWTWDKFEPGKGGSGVRWSEETAGRVDFAVPERGAPFEGFRFRTVKELTVNFIWLYIYSESPAQNIRVAFDDIVVARSYVGPLAALNKSARRSNKT